MSAPPNILLVMVDQMAAAPLPPYGGRVVQAPHLSALADRGVVFDAAYCNSPICAPSRFSMLTGRLPTAIDAFDNASELPASLPTLAHRLCALGYRTILAGKMHFIGPDQLHGYEERLTTDIYPADFDWTPDWQAGPTDAPSGISMRNVRQAGVCVRSLQMDYDDEVEHFATQRLYDLARAPDERPFFMTVSFSHPHPPYTIDAAHWDRYPAASIDPPQVPPIPFADRDAHSQWLHVSHKADLQPVTPEQVRDARHAYYGMISYVDDKLGRLLAVLEACRLADDTLVVFTSDHGEMLGERGMWYKQTFFEPSVRVPLVFAPARAPAAGTAGTAGTAAATAGTVAATAATTAPARIGRPVSLVDLLPTLVAIGRGEPMGGRLRPAGSAVLDEAPHRRVAGGAQGGATRGAEGGAPGGAVAAAAIDDAAIDDAAPMPIDGRSLLPLMRGESLPDRAVISEYTDMGVVAPCRMLRRGRFKLMFTHGHPWRLYDLEADPLELHDLVGTPGPAADALAALGQELLADWSPDDVHRRVLESQRRRRFIRDVMRRSGRFPDWSHQARRDDAQRFVRSAGAAGAKARARFPFVP